MTMRKPESGKSVTHNRNKFSAAVPEWMARKACVGVDPDMFFCDENKRESVDDAKAICETCPVVSECLSWAYSTGSDYGIFGGMTAKERRKLRRNELRRRNYHGAMVG